MFENIIDKEYINTNIRPFTPNDGLFNATVREAIKFDIGGKIDSKIITDLLNNLEGLEDDEVEKYQTYLDNGLREAIGYFVYSRAIRTAEGTVTKYGYTIKNDASSYPAEQSKIVSDSNYYKNIGEQIISQVIKDFNLKSKVATTTDWVKCRIVGE